MLVLTRKLGEGIVIGPDVIVRIIEVKGGQVKLGIAAPRSTTVHREEVYKRICEENVRAAAHVPSQMDDIIDALDEGADRMDQANGKS